MEGNSENRVRTPTQSGRTPQRRQTSTGVNRTVNRTANSNQAQQNRQRPQMREESVIDLGGYAQQQSVEPPKSSKKISLKTIIIAVVAVLIVGSLLGVRAKLAKNLDVQRSAVLKEQANLKGMISGYDDNIMPFLLECIAYAKSKTSDYDSVLKAKDTFDKSGKEYSDYKTLKVSVDGFINYTKSVSGLVDTAGYKEKLNSLNFYSANISNSLKSYNQLVSNYNIFKNNFKYKFIGKNNEFKLIEE